LLFQQFLFKSDTHFKTIHNDTHQLSPNFHQSASEPPFLVDSTHFLLFLENLFHTQPEESQGTGAAVLLTNLTQNTTFIFLWQSDLNAKISKDNGK